MAGRPPGMAPAQYVFGYGSLAAGAELRPATLLGHRRVWGVAMDNRVDIPGYKSYRSSADGSRPAVYVAFLDIAADASATTHGALRTVDAPALRALDARERNYDRIDVTELIDGAPPGTVWTYRGCQAGRARLAEGIAHGTAVIDAGYARSVADALSALGCEPDVDPRALPTMCLQRVEIAPAGPGRPERPARVAPAI